MKIKDDSTQVLPQLRFPEFKGDKGWKVKPLNKLAKKCTEKNSDETITRVFTNSAIMGVVDQRDYFDKDIANAKNLGGYIVVEKESFVYNPRCSVTAPVGPISKNKLGLGVMSPLYTVFKFKKEENGFYEQYFLTTSWHGYLKSVANSGARHDRMSISSKDFMDMPLPVPSVKEQQKIANCLASLDELITAESEYLDALHDHKQGMLQQLFPREGESVPKLRFKGFTKVWKEKKLENLLKYEQPTKFIVKDTQYKDAGMPVLTANKGFILGYTDETEGIYKNLPVIIFDDFTTDMKFVDFPFKVKSSAIKILSAKNDNVMGFIYGLMKNISVDATQHKRHYISVYQNLPVLVPSIKEQQKIADCLSSIDELIAAQTDKIDTLKQHKKGLMQQLFPRME